MRKGTKLLFPRPRQRAVSQLKNHKSRLSSPKQVQRSIENDLALTVTAKREQEENVAEEGRIRNARSRFELTRDQVIFGLKIIVTVLCMTALVGFAFTNPAPLAILVSGGGTLAGIVALLFRRSSDTSHN